MSSHHVEEQVILRVPPEVAEQLRVMIKTKKKKPISITMDEGNAPRTGKLTVDFGLNLSNSAGGSGSGGAGTSAAAAAGPVHSGVVDYRVSLVDVPTIIELYKTFDATGYYKTGDIHQMFIADPIAPTASATKSTPSVTAAAAAVGAIPPPSPAAVRAPTHPIDFPSGLTPPTHSILPKLYNRQETARVGDVFETEKLLDKLWKGDKIEEIKVIEVEEEVEVEVGEDGDWADGDEKAGGAVAGADRTPGKSPAIGAGSNRPGTVIASSASSIVRRNTPSASPAIGASPMRAGSATPGSIRGADEDEAMRAASGAQDAMLKGKTNLMPPPPPPLRFQTPQHTPITTHPQSSPVLQHGMTPTPAVQPQRTPVIGTNTLPLPPPPQQQQQQPFQSQPFPLQMQPNQFPPQQHQMQQMQQMQASRSAAYLLPQSQQSQYHQPPPQQPPQPQPQQPYPYQPSVSMTGMYPNPMGAAGGYPPQHQPPQQQLPQAMDTSSGAAPATTVPIAAAPAPIPIPPPPQPAPVPVGPSPAVLALRAEIAGLDQQIAAAQAELAKTRVPLFAERFREKLKGLQSQREAKIAQLNSLPQ